MTDERPHYGPGEKAPRSGLWRATSHEKADIALSAGDTFPPLEETGARWVLFQATEPSPGGAGPDALATATLEQLTGAAYEAALHELIRAARTAANTPELPTARHLRAQRDLRHAVAAFDRLLEGYDVETTVEIEQDEPPLIPRAELEETAAELTERPAELHEGETIVPPSRGLIDRLRGRGDEEPT